MAATTRSPTAEGGGGKGGGGFQKGDSVEITNAKKYDALSPNKAKGVVDFVHASGEVAVRVGKGQMNVSAKDLKKLG